MYISTENQDLLGLAVTFNLYSVGFNTAVIEVCEFLSTVLHVIQLWINSF